MILKWGKSNVHFICMDTNSLISLIYATDFNKDVSENFGKYFGTLNYDERKKNRLPVEKNKRLLGLMKDGKGGKIITISAAAAAATLKPYSNCVQKDAHGIDESELIRAKKRSKILSLLKMCFRYNKWFYNTRKSKL